MICNDVVRLTYTHEMNGARSLAEEEELGAKLCEGDVEKFTNWPLTKGEFRKPSTNSVIELDNLAHT